MSAIPLVPLLAATLAAALGGTALHTVRGLRRQLVELRVQLAAAEARVAEARTAVPPARTPPVAEEVRAAVAEALAEERERELAEARAYWAAQEAREADAEGPVPGERGAERTGHAEYGADALDEALLDALLDRTRDDTHGPDPLVPRQPDRSDGDREEAESHRGGRVDDEEDDGTASESPELAAARRRHPSHPGFGLDGEPAAPTPASASAPVLTDRERTVRRLARLAEARTPLADVRPGPLGALDVYVFADGTTVCLTPGDRRTAERLASALREGAAPVLLGGSGVFGGYTLTFLHGEENVYVLADRVIASL